MKIAKEDVKEGMVLKWIGSNNTIRGGEVVDLAESGCFIWRPASGRDHPGSFYWWDDLLSKDFIEVRQPG
jgi:hypothetical protein